MISIRSILTLIAVSFALLGQVVTATAQPPVPAPEAGFEAFRCDFEPTENTAQIRATLTDSEGRPLSPDEYMVNISVVGSDEILARELVEATPLTEREPLQVILVLDITNTVPLREIINALSTQLMPELDINDEVALITFGGVEISPVTRFYTDKNRLINENILDLVVQDGDNRIYDALLDAVSATSASSNVRQVVLLVTDSGRRDEEQADIDTIIERAQDNETQIYTVGFYTRDRPDEADLRQIANETNGYSWILQEDESTRATIEAGVSDLLGEFVRTLNSEVLIQVDMTDLEPDINGRVLFNISIDTENEIDLEDEISCPVEILSHSINFIDRPYETPVTEPVEVQVEVTSELSLDDTSIVFWVNDEIMQNSNATTFTFDPATAQPGINSIAAQLRNRNDDVLVTTPTTLNLFAQQIIQLNIIENTSPDLSGQVVFEAVTNPQVNLPNVQYRISVEGNPSVNYPLGDGAARVEDNGVATLTVNDLRSEIEELFPNLTEDDSLQIRAFVPSSSPQSPNWAESNVITIGYVTPPTLQENLPFTIPYSPYLLPIALSIILFLFNLYLLRQVRQSRIRRMIDIPDEYELDNQLMAVTVRFDGRRETHVLTKKTVFVGRGSSNDINLGDDPNISRQHGAIMWRKEQWYYSNRKPRTKVRVNGKQSRGYRLFTLEPVTEIEIGDAQLVFHSNAQQDLSEFIKTNL